MAVTLSKASVAEIGPRVFAHLPPIFQECCGESYKYSLELPFVIGDMVYATDGKILVRTRAGAEAVAVLAGIEGRKFPISAATQFDDLSWRAEPTPLSAVPEPEPCPCCNTCIHCGWRAGCEDCYRTGLAWTDVRIPLTPRVAIGHRYAHMLKRYGALLYLTSDIPDRPVRFVAGDVEGFLMPLREKD